MTLPLGSRARDARADSATGLHAAPADDPGAALHPGVVRSLPFGVTIWRRRDPGEPSSFHLVASNRAADELAGFALEPRTGERLLDLIPDAEASGVLSLLSEVERTGAPRDLGPVSIGAAHVPPRSFGFHAFLLGDGSVGMTAENLTQLQRREEEARRLQDIALAVGEADDFRAALGVVLQKVCEATGWTYGQAWAPRSDGTRLEWYAAYHGPDDRLTKFRRECETLSFGLGAGLPGQVWASKRSHWVENTEGSDVFSRSRAAVEAGLESCVAVPVVAGGDVVAVIEFLQTGPQPEDPRLLGTVQTIAVQLGWLMQRKQTEERLRRSHHRLRTLSGRIQSIQEEERTTVAREIHDQLGQALTAVKMETTWLHKRISEGYASRKDLMARLESMARLVDSTIDQVRRISAKLRPGILDELGLSAAMEWQAEDFQRRTGVLCTVFADLGESRLERHASTALFRIFQESLTNVARHAGASWVRAVLRRVGGRLVLEVHDNGRGISEREISSAASLGLLGMSERARLIGGQLEISGRAGGGTTVRVTAPLRRHSGAAGE